MSERPVVDSVHWKRVGLFYAIALGGAVLVALVIVILRLALGPAALVAGVAAAALLYMPLPLLAGLVVERVAGRRPLIVAEWRALRRNFWRTYGRNALVAVALILLVVVLGFAVAWLAGAIGLPGAGHLVSSDAELQRRQAQVPGTGSGIPSISVLLAAGLGQGILAGLTINGVFAFGEEYGWRGVLADELRPLGLFRATLLIGVLWGFWHAPIIVLGHNYGPNWAWGIPTMIAWTVPLSFVLTWARERTGSVLAPAMLHGACNGVLGTFVFVIIDGNVLISLPVGVLMALTFALLAGGLWSLARPPGRPAAQG